jgi:hypothetical protein
LAPRCRGDRVEARRCALPIGPRNK